jgi:hypothetical protein
MEVLLNTVLPIAVIVIIAVIYILWLTSRRQKVAAPEDAETKDEWKKAVPKSAPITPFMDTKVFKFYEALKAALPAEFIAAPHVAIEKLFAHSARKELRMTGQFADFVIFTRSFMPVLVIDLFDMSIVSLDNVNKIKNIFKDVIRNSGLAILDYKLDDNYNIDELRRDIANAINPLRKVN